MFQKQADFDMEGMSMPFNWPKCGPALPSPKQPVPDVDVSRLHMARAMLSRSLGSLEREKVSNCIRDLRLYSLSGILPHSRCGFPDARPADESAVSADGHILGAERADACNNLLRNPPSPQMQDSALTFEIARNCSSFGADVIQESKESLGDELREEGEDFIASSVVQCSPDCQGPCPSVSGPPISSSWENSFVLVDSGKSGAGLNEGLPCCGSQSLCNRPTSEPGPSVSRKSAWKNASADVGDSKETDEVVAEARRWAESGHSSRRTGEACGATACTQQVGVGARDCEQLASDQERREPSWHRESERVGGGKGNFPAGSRGRKRDAHFYELRHGRFLEGRLVYRQTFVIRSYEVGVDKTASVDTLTNLFQEVALNHVWLLGISGDGFGATVAMNNHRLICVVTRMHVEVERNELVDIDSWLAPDGRHGLRRDWLVRDHKNGHILARATSTWVMMNKDTRKLSKVPKDVRAEIAPYFADRAVFAEPPRRVEKIREAAQFTQSGLRPCRRDMDANQHVNNVKYIDWIMESIPASILATHELSSITMEYRQECGRNYVVESLTNPETQHPASEYTLVMTIGSGQVNISPVRQNKSFAYSSRPLSFDGAPASPVDASLVPLQYTHMLRTATDNAELLRGRTTWRLRKRERHLPSTYI